MLDLQRYRRDLITDSRRLDLFVHEIIEEIDDADKAEFWFTDLETYFENAIEEWREANEND